MKPRYTPLAAAVLAAISVSAYAADESPATAAAPEASPAAVLPTVKATATREAEKKTYAPAETTVGGKVPTALRDVPQSVTVINKAVLDDQAATSLVEALRNVPGITISAGEGGQIGDSINLRGFSARTDVFLDGFRDRGQYARDTFSLDAVEVLKGPSSMLFGRGSTGGVINQSTKKPQLKDSTEVSASVGTDDYYRTTLDTNSKLSDTSAVRLAAFWQDVGTDRDFSEKTGFGFAPSIRFGIGQPTEVTVSALIQRNRDIPDYGGPLLPNRVGGVSKPVDIGSTSFAYNNDHFDQDVNVLTVALRHKINSNLTVRNQTQYSQTRTDASPTPLGSIAVTGSASGPCKTTYGTTPLSTIPFSCLQAIRQDKNRVLHDSAVFNQTDLVAKFATGSIKHTVTTGVEVGADSYQNDNYTWLPAATATTVNTFTNGPRPGAAVKNTVTETDANTVAAYVNEQLDLTEQLKLVGGVRYDRFSAKTSVLTVATGSLAKASTTDDMLSYRAGIIFQPDDVQSYYVSYGTSFNPTAEGLTIATTQVGLEPEKNTSYEVGTKWALMNEALILNAALFQVEKENARTTDPVTKEVKLDGDIQVQGFEMSAVGQINENWQVIAGYTFLDSEIKEGLETQVLAGTTETIYSKGKSYTNTPRHSATLWTTYRLTPEWQVGAGLSGSEDRYVNNFETAEIPAYLRADAMVAYLQPSYDIRLNLQNLTDELYYETASSGRATAAMGFRAILTGTYRF